MHSHNALVFLDVVSFSCTKPVTKEHMAWTVKRHADGVNTGRTAAILHPGTVPVIPGACRDILV